MDFSAHVAHLRYSDGHYVFSVFVSEDTAVNLEKYPNGLKLNVSVSKWREHRSLDANAYMWVLLTEIANHSEIEISKEEAYENALHSYGTLKMIDGEVSKIQVLRGTDISDKPGHWMYNKLLTLYDEYDNTLYFDEYLEIKGSSEYNTKEMSTLLNGVIHDAKELGIETIPDQEKQKLLEEWGEYYSKKEKTKAL